MGTALLKYPEQGIRGMMRAKGITDADVAAAGGYFDGGFYYNTRERHREMMRPADTRRAQEMARPFGLGDAVAAVAQPIAGAIDAVLGTNIKECGGCAKRREALNRAVPLRK
jgi:hypothetical protein